MVGRVGRVVFAWFAWLGCCRVGEGGDGSVYLLRWGIAG